MNNSPCNDAFKSTDIVGGGKLVFDILNHLKVCIFFLCFGFCCSLYLPHFRKKKALILLLARFLKKQRVIENKLLLRPVNMGSSEQSATVLRQPRAHRFNAPTLLRTLGTRGLGFP